MKTALLSNRGSIETERLLLRRWRSADAANLFKYASDPEIGTNAGWEPHSSEDESRILIRTVFNNDYTFAIELKHSKEVIGCIGWLPKGIANIPIPNRDTEIGYWIAKPFWNEGFCTEALNAIIDVCFSQKHYRVIWGDFFIDNPASGKVMEKCGFRPWGDQIFLDNIYGGKERPVQIMKLSRIRHFINRFKK